MSKFETLDRDQLFSSNGLTLNMYFVEDKMNNGKRDLHFRISKEIRDELIPNFNIDMTSDDFMELLDKVKPNNPVDATIFFNYPFNGYSMNLHAFLDKNHQIKFNIFKVYGDETIDACVADGPLFYDLIEAGKRGIEDNMDYIQEPINESII